MKKPVCFAVMALISVFSMSADLIPDQNQKGKWGYVDEGGAKVIDYRYDSADFFVDGRAKVGKDGKYGFIDTNGKEIIKVKYNVLDKYRDGVYKVAADGKYQDGALLDEKYGFIDYQGNVILETKYETISQMKDGHAWVKSGDKYGYIDENLKLIIPCEYNFVGSFNADNLVWVCKGGGVVDGHINGGKYGIYKGDGTVFIKPEYQSIGTFIQFEYKYNEEALKDMSYTIKTINKESGTHHLLRKQLIEQKSFSKIGENPFGYYYSKKTDGAKNGVMDPTGKELMQEGKWQHAFYPTEGYMLVITSNDRYNYINMLTGQPMLKDDVSTGWAFKDGYAVVAVDGNRNKNAFKQFFGNTDFGKEEKYFLIDVKGTVRSKTYSEIFPLKEGVHIVCNKNGSAETFGMIGFDGTEIKAAAYSAIYPSSEGLFCIRETSGGLWGYVDKTGEYAIPAKYQYAFSFRYGMGLVQQNKLWGAVDAKGKTLIDCKWKSLYFPIEKDFKYLWALQNNDKIVCLDIATQQQAFPGEYGWIRNFNQDEKGVAFVGLTATQIGCIDETGKVIIPMSFDSGTLAQKAYNQLINSGKQQWEEIDTYRLKLDNNADRNKKTLFDVIDANLWDY